MDKIVKTAVIIAGVSLVGFSFVLINQQESSPTEEAREEERVLFDSEEARLENEETEEDSLREVSYEGIGGDTEDKESIGGNSEKDTPDSFIQCLKEQDVAIYGSAWCPFCKQLAESLGGYEVVDPIYTECTEEEKKCREEMIGTSVPEIQINGEAYKGSRDPKKLAEVTGCTYHN